MVTAYVTCYNHARFVEEALESVRAQNYPNIQLIVLDDCSTDRSAEVIQKWLNQNWPNALFLRNEHNMGVCRTLNRMLGHARGKYIAGCAADDAWMPGKLHHQVSLMEQQPEHVGVLYSDAYQMDEQGNLLSKMFIETYRTFAEPPSGDIHDILWQGNFIPGMTMLTRKACYEKVGLYDEQLAFEDWDMWLRISKHFHFLYSPTPSAKYRIVSTSLGRTKQAEILASVKQMFIKHLLAGTISPIARNRALDWLEEQALQAYQHNQPEAHKLLRSLLSVRSDKALVTMCLFSRLGIPYSCFCQLQHLWHKLRSSDARGNARFPVR